VLRAYALLGFRRTPLPDIQLARGCVRRNALQKPTELVPLIQLLRSEELSTVAEIGTAHGGTFWLWCRLAAPDATVVSMDLPGEFAGGGGSADEVLPLLRGYGGEAQKLAFIRDDSHAPTAVEALISVLDGRQLDFLFIDGDHSYEGVKADFETFAPFVKPGGLVAFHDTLPQQSWGVSTFWLEVRDRFESFEFVDPGDNRLGDTWGGIGVLRWHGDGESSPLSR